MCLPLVSKLEISKAMIQRLDRLELALDKLKNNVDVPALEKLIKSTVVDSVRSSFDHLLKENYSISDVSAFDKTDNCDPRNLSLRLDSSDVTDCEQSGAESRSWATAVSRKYKRLRKHSPGSRLSDDPPTDPARGQSSKDGDTSGKLNYANVLKVLINPNQKSNSQSKLFVETFKRNPTKVFGTSQNPSNIKAARDLIKKRFCYVGNLDVKCKADDLNNHLSSLGIEKLKCNLAKSNFKNTSSFHVCINAKDRTVFETSSNWPQHVVIQEWVFKEKKTVQPVDSKANNSDSTILADHDVHSDLVLSRHSSETSMEYGDTHQLTSHIYFQHARS